MEGSVTSPLLSAHAHVPLLPDSIIGLVELHASIGQLKASTVELKRLQKSSFPSPKQMGTCRSKLARCSRSDSVETPSSSNEDKRSTSKYDIFLSFRGVDTRRGFTSHLYDALTNSGFRVFRDDDELERGQVISMELLQAINESRFAIVVLSKNYASSSWCLNELQRILTSRNTRCQIVLPIFYDVEPSDVRKQRGLFGAAFAEVEHKFQHDQPQLQEWRASLTEVAYLAGFHSTHYGNEAQLVNAVVENLQVKFRSEVPPVSVSDALIGIELRVDEMLTPLGIGLDDVRFIGIWGIGGVGKTTLARALYDTLSHQFELHCFLGNVRELSERNGILHLQNQLLSHLTIKDLRIVDELQGKNALERLFRNRKVMLILDDVNHIRQLENLAGRKEWFGDGSRIIITTRDLHLLTSHVIMDEIHEVQPMNRDESFQLFCEKAFGGRVVPDDEQFRQLALSAINYAGGLPLALCVLGSFFCGRYGLTEWEDALDLLRQDSDNDIFKTLRISYNHLSYGEKTVFLDIACFFNMWGKDEIIQILESWGHPANAGLLLLREKSLVAEIEIGRTTYIYMHDLLQEMGRLIVEKSREIDERFSRLWLPDEIDQVLERNLGREATDGVVLPHSFDKDEVYWHPEAFLKMHQLKLLIISCNFDHPLELNVLPGALKVLHWYGYPNVGLPSRERMKQLVYLKMHNSKIMDLSNVIQSLENLEILDLSHSKNLLPTLYLGGLKNLKRLLLEGCTSLVKIQLRLLYGLVEVNLKGCLNLKALKRNLEMNSLEKLVLSGCIQLRNLPEFGEGMSKLRTLDVKETVIAGLPESLGYLTGIETLDLKGCRNIFFLPRNIQNLKCLNVLDISGCSALSKLPENLDKNEALEKLDASGTDISEVPSSICSLQKLKTLAFHGCKKGLTLPASIFSIKSLEELDLSYCNIVGGIIPNDLSGLSSLQKLDLSGNEFVNLPDGCICNHLNLRFLYLNSCPKLQSLPQPSPSLNLMDAGECGSLKTLSEKTLLRHFASMEQDGQHAAGLKRNITTFSVTITGSEIPSWFENQNHLPLNEKHVASVTIDIPEGEWLGIGLCTVIDDKICLPRWRFDFKASDGRYVSVPGRTREHEKEIKSSHLWMVYWKIKEENRDTLSRNYNQIRLKFCTDHWEQPPSKLVNEESIKCGWRFIGKGDLERLKDVENTISSEAEEHVQCSLSQGETSQTIVRECETPALCSKDEVKVDDACKLADDSSPSESRSSSNCCHFDDGLSGSKQASAEEIFKELSQIADLTDTELVQIYVILTGNQREYESFKALPTLSLRKLWISTQIKRNYS